MLKKRIVKNHEPEDIVTAEEGSYFENLLSKSKLTVTQSSFQDIYYNSNIKNKRPLKFYIVNELITSERDYLANLELICSDFRNTLKCNHHRSHYIDHIDHIPKFDSLLDIYNFSKSLLHELECRIMSSE